MSVQERISKLQGLLERIQKNASRPHSATPVAYAAPPAVEAPPAPTFAPPAPAFAGPAPSSFDQSVDDLLGASPEPSPVPIDVEIPFDSVPPVGEISASPAPDSEPIPLVSLATGQAPPPPPIDDAFGLDSEVSEVRVTPATREPAPEVTVAAIAAEAEPIGTEELSEDDLVEVIEGTPPPGAADVDIDFDDEEEPAPASSQRVASTMDEALAAAAEQIEAEREVPLKTPPPESGPQAAPLQTRIAAPPASDVDALLGSELDIPTRAESGIATSGPTPEQLGQTIELDEARGPSLELAEHKGSDLPEPARVEELEAALPGPILVGGYDANLQPPPEALDELEAHRRRQEDDIAPPPESLAQYPSVQPGAASPEIVPLFNSAPAAEGPEVVARPVPMGNPQTFGSVRESFRPSSFVELLDASLALSGE